MNVIYKKGITPKGNKSQKKVKSFESRDDAMKYGWKLANKVKKDCAYFIITEDGKCLNFNKTIIL